MIDETGKSLERETHPIPYAERDGEQGVRIVAKEVGAQDDVIVRLPQLAKIRRTDVPAILSRLVR
jgi:hypothetical protein